MMFKYVVYPFYLLILFSFMFGCSKNVQNVITETTTKDIIKVITPETPATIDTQKVSVATLITPTNSTDIVSSNIAKRWVIQNGTLSDGRKINARTLADLKFTDLYWIELSVKGYYWLGFKDTVITGAFTLKTNTDSTKSILLANFGELIPSQLANKTIDFKLKRTNDNVFETFNTIREATPVSVDATTKALAKNWRFNSYVTYIDYFKKDMYRGTTSLFSQTFGSKTDSVTFKNQQSSRTYLYKDVFFSPYGIFSTKTTLLDGSVRDDVNIEWKWKDASKTIICTKKPVDDLDWNCESNAFKISLADTAQLVISEIDGTLKNAEYTVAAKNEQGNFTCPYSGNKIYKKTLDKYDSSGFPVFYTQYSFIIDCNELNKNKIPIIITVSPNNGSTWDYYTNQTLSKVIEEVDGNLQLKQSAITKYGLAAFQQSKTYTINANGIFTAYTPREGGLKIKIEQQKDITAVYNLK